KLRKITLIRKDVIRTYTKNYKLTLWREGMVMKKIKILVGPALAYLICYIIYGFRQSIFSQADIPVTVLFLLECVGYCVIGMLLLIVSEAIRKEIRDQGTKIL